MPHRQPLPRHRQPDHQLRHVPAPVLGVAPPPQRRVAPPPGRRAGLLALPVVLVDLAVQRGGVEEQQFGVELQQPGGAPEDLLLEGLAVGLEEVHGAVQVLQREARQAGQAHVLGQPLQAAVALGGGGAGAVGDQGEQGALDVEGEAGVVGARLGNDLGQAEALPQGVENEQIAEGPGAHEAAVGVAVGELLGVAALEDAAGQAAQGLGGLGVIGAADIVEDADARALAEGVPGVVGDLEVGEEGAVLAFLAGDSQVHVISIYSTRNWNQ